MPEQPESFLFVLMGPPDSHSRTQPPAEDILALGHETVHYTYATFAYTDDLPLHIWAGK